MDTHPSDQLRSWQLNSPLDLNKFKGGDVNVCFSAGGNPTSITDGNGMYRFQQP